MSNVVLLLVVAGEGYVRGTLQRLFVETGDAVYWKRDEEHGTLADTSMTAIVIELPGIGPSKFMTLKSDL